MKMKKIRIIVEPELCKGQLCHICIQVCPVKILKPSTIPSRMGGMIPYSPTPEKCIVCRKCEYMCPDFAISIEETVEEENLVIER